MPKTLIALFVAAIVVGGATLLIVNLGSGRGSDAAAGALSGEWDARFTKLERSVDTLRRQMEKRPKIAGAQVQPKDASKEAEETTGGEALDTLAKNVEDLAVRLEALETKMKGIEQDPIRTAEMYLASESAELRRRGIGMLKRLAPSDPKARAAIRGMLADADGKVRQEALEAIGETKDREAFPQVQQLLGDQEVAVRGEACGTIDDLLDGLPPDAPEHARAAAALAARMDPQQESDSSVRQAAVDALARVRGSTEGTQALIKALQDPVEAVSREAAASLGQAAERGDAAAREALPQLRALYDSGSPGSPNQLTLARALQRFGDPVPAQKEAARLSQIATTHEDERERARAIERLAQFGGREYRDLLTRALNDPSESVRRAAERALRRLEER